MTYKVTGTSPDRKPVEHEPTQAEGDPQSLGNVFKRAVDWMDRGYADVQIKTSDGTTIISGPAIRQIYELVMSGDLKDKPR